MTHTALIGALVTAAAILLVAHAATAGFTGLRVENVTVEVGTPGCLYTNRVYADFDLPEDQVIATGGPRGGECCRADLNGDGLVNFDDLLSVLSQWGDRCVP